MGVACRALGTYSDEDWLELAREAYFDLEAIAIKLELDLRTPIQVAILAPE